jgi:hypothetical protein
MMGWWMWGRAKAYDTASEGQGHVDGAVMAGSGEKLQLGMVWTRLETALSLNLSLPKAASCTLVALAMRPANESPLEVRLSDGVASAWGIGGGKPSLAAAPLSLSLPRSLAPSLPRCHTPGVEWGGGHLISQPEEHVAVHVVA